MWTPLLRPAVLIAVATLIGSHGADSVEAGQAAFTEEAGARGIDYTPFFDGTFGGDVPYGGGTGFVDLDDDGDADIVAVGALDGTVGIFENDGTGHFIDRSATSNAPQLLNGAGVCAADFDRDGDLDVFLSGWKQPNILLRNDGNFTFTDVAVSAGVRGDSDDKSGGSCWGDYNGDGWMDLYVCNYTTANKLYRNNGDGTFTDVAADLGVLPPWPVSLQSAFVDIDKDGDCDLYIASDKGTTCQTFPERRNYLYLNDGGTFQEIGASANAQACADAMSIAIGDFDANRYLDFYVTNIPVGNVLLCNQGNNTFVHEEVPADVESFSLSWGAEFFDFDNSGVLDLYVCNALTNNRLYHQPGGWPCVDIGPATGVDDAGRSYGILSSDVDDDGDLDLLLHNNDDPLRLFINHEGETRNWAKFDIVGTGPNRYAIGTRVELRVGTAWQIREVIAGHNYKTQNHLVQHFGLDDATAIDEIVVTWPGGAPTRTLTGYSTNQTWTIVPPDKLGDANADGQLLIDDFVALHNCFTGATPGAVQSGCAVMDYDGDSDVDMDDYNMFLGAFDGPIEDCNSNGTADMTDIITGAADDANGNGVPG